MAKTSFLPKGELHKRKWLSNYSAKLSSYAPKVGVSAAEVTQCAADSKFYNFVCDAHSQHTRTTHEWTAYKEAAGHGPALGDVPVTPTLGELPEPVPADIFGRNCAMAARIKKHPNYTDAIGQDLGIIGADQSIDYTNVKPDFYAELQAGRPTLTWHKQGLSTTEIWVDRGDGKGFILLDISSNRVYTDKTTLPAPGSGAVWRYKGIFRELDQQIGLWSDITSVTVAG